MKLPNEKDVVLHALTLLNPSWIDDPYVDQLGEEELTVVLNLFFKATKHEELWEKFKSFEDEFSWSKEKINVFEELKNQVASLGLEKT